MPYVISTTSWHPNRTGAVNVTRTAVATLDAARAAVQQAICDNDPDYDADLLGPVDDLPEAGGTIGPLPDGTVIEVRPATRLDLLADLPGEVVRRMPRFTDDDIVAAWNAAH